MTDDEFSEKLRRHNSRNFWEPLGWIMLGAVFLCVFLCFSVGIKWDLVIQKWRAGTLFD
jgi:hypothetical protein